MKYFLHDTNAFQDEKITELFIRFGYEGIGLFFTALERLAAQEKPIKTTVLKKQLSVGKKLEKVWEFMEEIELISSKNGETFNENLLKFSEKYKIQKEKTRERVAKFREGQADTKNVTRYNRVSNAPKVKVSKVKDTNVSNSSVADATSEFSLTHKLRLAVEEIVPGYYWNGKDGKAALELAEKLKHSYKAAKNTDPTDERIVDSLKTLISKSKTLTPFHHFSTVAALNEKYNGIVSAIRSQLAQKTSDKRMVV